MGILGLIVLILIVLYFPPTQDLIVKAVISKVNSDPDTELTVEKFRLSPPLRLSLKGATYVQKGDTLADIGAAQVRVALLPLIKGEVKVSKVAFEDTRINLGHPDSSMWLRAALAKAEIADTRVMLSSKDIEIDRFSLEMPDIDMRLRPDTTAADTTKSEPLPWHIGIRDIAASALTYKMSVAESIDSLRVHVPSAYIGNVTVDMPTKQVAVRTLAIGNLTAAFLTPPANAYDTPAPSAASVVPADTIPSEPWQIEVDSIDITAKEALYGVAGAIPQDGLDMNWLQVSDVDIRIDSLLSRGSTMRVPIKRIAAHERCGLDLELSGLFAMNADSIEAQNIVANTAYSHLELNAVMGMSSESSLPSPLRALGGGYIAPADIRMVMPSMTPMLAGIPSASLLDIDINITGQNDIFDINDLSVELPRCFRISAVGAVAQPTDIDRMEGAVTLSGKVYNSKFLAPALDGGSLAVPPMTLNGRVRMHGGLISGKLDATTSGGRLALDADWRARREGYDLKLKTDSFPVEAFMPSLGVRRLTTNIDIKGHGYDFFSRKTAVAAKADIDEVGYQSRLYRDMKVTADIADGNAVITASSPNPIARLDLRAAGNLAGDTLRWHLSSNVANLDLQQMGLSDSVMKGAVKFTGDVTYVPAVRRRHGMGVEGSLDIESIDWLMSSNRINTTDLIVGFATDDSITRASLDNHDLHALLTLPMPLDSVTARLTQTSAVLDSASLMHSVNVDALQKAMPPVHFSFKAGENNVINNFLQNQDIDFTSARLNLDNDSLIRLDGQLLSFTNGSTVIDTIDIAAHQKADKLLFDLHIGNRPGTLDQWAQVTATGEIDADHATILLDQQNIQGQTGYHLGFDARYVDDHLTLSVIPREPKIGYKDWVVNDSNFIAINTLKKHLDANLLMKSAESSIHLYTDHNEANDSTQEDVILDIDNIKLQEWISVNPFAPPVSGSLSTDMRFGWDEHSIGGHGLISIDDLVYGKERVGTFDLGVDLDTNQEGTVHAAVTLMVDSIKTITAVGNLNDSTAANPFLLDFRMIHFPLTVLNPFLPADKARMTGTLNGTMDITGSLSEPIFNGFLDFDQTTLTVPMIGTTYTFSDAKLPVDSNVVKIENFALLGGNNNPLLFNGIVDARSLKDVKIDLQAKANEMQAIKSKKGRGVEIIGNAFINLTAAVRGTLSRLNINADLSLLSNTNITYLMSAASGSGGLSSKSTGDVVKFVNFADTVAVESADSITSTGMLTNINAILRLREGAVINVELSANGKDRIQLYPSGTLDYTSNYMNDSRLTGRLNVNKGYVRYSPPLMSEKNFTFQEGSYVSFMGDVTDPYIHFKAVDVLKANVEQEGQNSRLINFDVILNINNTLSNIDVSFDLATKDDITVANELQSMTPEQRANQAMNLLLYNVYTGPGTKASSSLSGNPLYSFLESQVNSWAANHVKGVDLSFGIDQYDKTVDGTSSTATSYSYKMSKSLFNDRFKISVGGNYATEDDANQNLSQNLINDISFEYYITPSGSMYVKIFRHTGYESILEGEVTQTGVGFVYKRKLRNMLDLFRPMSYFRKLIMRKAAAEKAAAENAAPAAPTEPSEK
ncbi:MAG: translocation/assembly module TamB [Muribaculaceae bacterium]|nr:translocation/assembly module TamB [Muribaculaceae bacterium]